MLRTFSVVALLVAACSRPGEADRERFVRHFLTSVRDDTGFFRGYVPDPSKIVEVRARYPGALRGDFGIIKRAAYGDGTFDYGTECGPNLVCVVYLTERDGSVRSADLTIEPRP